MVWRFLSFFTKYVEFDALVKAQSKNSTVFQGAKYPRFLIRTMVQLDDSVKTASAASKDSKKKLNALNAKALNAMKQKLKRWGKGEGIEEQMDSFRAVCDANYTYPNPFFKESRDGGR